MSEDKKMSDKKTVIAIGYKVGKVPKAAKEILGGTLFHQFKTFRPIKGFGRFVTADHAAFKCEKVGLVNPAHAIDDKTGEPIVKTWTLKDGLLIGEA